jgi:hypothetical protein
MPTLLRLVAATAAFGVAALSAAPVAPQNAQWQSLLKRVQAAAPRVVQLKASSVVSHPPLNEISGIVKSGRHRNVYWVHNDSGDRARFFAIREDGGGIMPAALNTSHWVNRAQEGKTPFEGIALRGARNVDWEDIAISGDTLYIADVGNNGNARKNLGIYAVPEPDPARATEATPFAFYPVVYPDQKDFPPKDHWRFDCEAVFVFNRKLHLLTKHRLGTSGLPDVGTNLYRLDTQHTDKPNVLTKIDSRANLGGWVTAADVSPNGRTLAVLTHAPVSSIWLFALPEKGDRLLSGSSRQIILTGGRQLEALCFVDDRTILLTNEQRDLFRVSVP